MRALVVYESMYGNTHTVALRIAEGLASAPEVHVDVVAVGDASAERLAAADLLVVGGPTHMHGMSSKLSRGQAITEQTLEAEAKKGHPHEVDPDAEGPGLRDWFDALHGQPPLLAAAFDTRFDASALLVGRASKGIARRLRRHHFEVVAEPESFLVDAETHLVDGEEERAVAWGRTLLGAVAQVPRPDGDGVGAAVRDMDAILESGGRFAPPG
jgi:hypothetical protein